MSYPLRPKTAKNNGPQVDVAADTDLANLVEGVDYMLDLVHTPDGVQRIPIFKQRP